MSSNLIKPSVHSVQVRSCVYVIALWCGSVAAVGCLLAANVDIGNAYVVALLAATACIAERGRVELTPDVSHSVSLVPTLFAAVLFGPLAAAIVAAASFASEFRAPHLRW